MALSPCSRIRSRVPGPLALTRSLIARPVVLLQVRNPWPVERNDSTAAVVFCNEEGGGRSAGGRWKLLPTARTRRKGLRYEALGEVTKKQASDALAQRLAAAGSGKAPTRSRMTF